MNESIAPIIVLIILGLLMLWAGAYLTLSSRRVAKNSQREMHSRNFTEMPARSLSKAFQRKPAQVKARKKVRQFVAVPIGGPPPLPQPEESQKESPEAEAEPPTPNIDVEPSPQATTTRNFRGQDLRGVRLRGENLAGADLSHCNLVRANLADTDLHGAILAYADLTNANLIGANLSGCDCTGTRFHGANLGGAKLCDSDLSSARFGPTTRPWAEVYSLRGDSRYPWRTVDIIGANLNGVDWQGANCTGSDIGRGCHDKELYWTTW